MKEWIKSKTIFIAGIIETVGVLLLTVQPFVEMIPGDWGIKAVGILMILMGVQQQLLRIVTDKPLTTKKQPSPEILALQRQIAELQNPTKEGESPKAF